MLFRSLAANVLASQPNPEHITPEELAAFAVVESSGDEGIWGDNGTAYGLYQFHLPRWLENGGTRAEWGRASAHTQTEVMLRALTKYAAKARAAKADRLTWLATSHNNGHGKYRQTAYSKKINAALKGMRQRRKV